MNLVHDLNTEAWDEWVEFRHKEKRIKIGPIAQKKQQKLLRQYPPSVQQEMIDHSISNSYQGLFPPKGPRKAHKTDEAIADRTRDMLAMIDRGMV